MNTTHSTDMAFKFKQCRGKSSGIGMYPILAYSNFAPEKYLHKNTDILMR